MDRQHQVHVLAGAALALVLAAGLLLLLPQILPQAESRAQQFFFILFLPGAWIFLLTVIAGNSRFLGQSIDPLRRADSRFLEVTLRVLTNSVEQGIVFAAFSLTWLYRSGDEAAQSLPAIAIIFILARIIFYLGYLKDSRYRSTGMALTYLVNGYLLIAIITGM